MPSHRLEEDLVRIVAPNPSPLTGDGTNSYLVSGSPSDAGAIIIDPGPESAPHLFALLEALGGQDLAGILITHSHRDHSPLANALSAQTGASILAFGPSGAGRSAIMEELAEAGDLGGGEGADPDFAPDIHLKDGETRRIGGHEITAIHTPGHFGNHMCFAWRDVLFSGDHVMGWSSTLVSPPDGDLTDFMESCGKLAGRKERIYYPGHGAPVADPQARVAWLIDHRNGREAQIRKALGGEPATAAEVTAQVYTDVAQHLWPAAERNVLAHLIDLTTRQIAVPEGTLSRTAKFRLL